MSSYISNYFTYLFLASFIYLGIYIHIHIQYTYIYIYNMFTQYLSMNIKLMVDYNG